MNNFNLTHSAVAFGAAFVAGAINSIAGGGTLVSFPALVWLGLPVVVRTAQNELSGQAEAADTDGALVVRLDTGERVRVLAGDVRLRPAVP